MMKMKLFNIGWAGIRTHKKLVKSTSDTRLNYQGHADNLKFIIVIKDLNGFNKSARQPVSLELTISLGPQVTLAKSEAFLFWL